MEGRKCPKCGLIRYSAVTRAWICERCGSVVTSKDNIEKAPAKEQGKGVTVYCDNSECLYNCEEECQRTSIKMEQAGGLHHPLLMLCMSAEQRKAPAKEQEQEK